MANNAPQYELSPMVGKAISHDRLNLKNDESIGATFAIRDNYTFFDQIELAYFNTNDVKFNTKTGATDVNRILLSGVKNYGITENTSLYALIGGGYEKITHEKVHADSSEALNWGGGIKYALTDAIAVKAEARQIFRGSSYRENTVLYSLGLAIPFGERAKKVAPKVEKEVVAKKVEKKVEKKMAIAPAVVKTETKSMIDMTKNVIAHFDSDKAIIKGADKTALQNYVNYLKKFPKSKLVVEGHTDATASEAHNRSLAARRAMNVKAYMVKLGLNAKKIRVESYGETMPVVDNKTSANRAMNRRTESKIIR